MFVFQVDRSGKTALHYAAANEHSGGGSEGMHDWLLQLGADKEHEDNVSRREIFIFILMPSFKLFATTAHIIYFSHFLV